MVALNFHRKLSGTRWLSDIMLQPFSATIVGYEIWRREAPLVARVSCNYVVGAIDDDADNHFIITQSIINAPLTLCIRRHINELLL